MEGLFQMFVLLTTANHPDIVMDLVHYNYLGFMAVVSYMVVTAIILMNLVLAVVANQFSEVYEYQRYLDPDLKI